MAYLNARRRLPQVIGIIFDCQAGAYVPEPKVPRAVGLTHNYLHLPLRRPGRSSTYSLRGRRALYPRWSPFLSESSL